MKTKSKKLIVKKNIFGISLLLLILFVAIGVRFYNLGYTPSGITNDEANIGYDAYSILKTGHDQWGEYLPLISFKGFGDYRLALYTYLVIPFVPIFGLTSLAIRLPSAIFGCIGIIFLFLILRKISDIKTALFGALLFTISPWAIGLSRIGIESNVAITFLLAGIYFFIRTYEKIRFYYISLFFFLLCIFTYTSYFLFSPLVLTVLLFYYNKKFLLDKKTIIGLIIFVLFIGLIVISKSTAGIRFSQIGFVNSLDSIGTTTVLNDQRGSCENAIPSPICKIVNNKLVLFISVFTKNYLNHFSTNFLYTDGTSTQYSILPIRGLFYIFEIIFFIFGCIVLLYTRKKLLLLFLICLLFAPIPDVLTGGGHYSRASNMIPFILIFEAYGVSGAFSFLQKKKVPLIFINTVFISLVSFSFIAFVIQYNTYFKDYYSFFSQYGYKEVMNLIKKNEEKYERIYVLRYLYDTKQYIYYLFNTQFEPKIFQKKENVEYHINTDGWVSINRINKIYFVLDMNEVLKDKELPEKILIIGHPKSFPEKIVTKDIIKDQLGNILFKAVKFSEYQSAVSKFSGPDSE